MSKSWWIELLVILFVITSCHKVSSKQNQEEIIMEDSAIIAQEFSEEIPEEIIPIVKYEYGIPLDSFTVVENLVREGQYLSKIFLLAGTPVAIAEQLHRIPRDSFDISNIHPGERYSAYYQDSILKYIVYKVSNIDAFRFDIKDSLEMHRFSKYVRYEKKVGEAIMETTLWTACKENNVNPMLAVKLGEVFQWTFDFFSLSKGDHFKAYYEELFVDSVSVGIGQIFAVALVHNGINYFAYYFDTTECKGYYNSKGMALRKQFLKAPINYNQISSTFSYNRGGNISENVKLHPGVDYVAPDGTSVVALGDGTITECSDKGDNGKTIRIRHNGDYTTAYMHLARFADGMTAGNFVRQGKVIGYIGKIGEDTESHLDFRMWKDGSPINPMDLDSPAADPIPQKYKSAFAELMEEMNKFIL